MKPIILAEVEKFVNQYYDNKYACLISGSHIDNKNNLYSDIDVVIFTKDRNTVFNETISFNDYKIQSIIIPVQIIQEVLWVDYVTCKGSLIDMISKGIVVFDTSNFTTYLISHTKKLKLIGGRPINEKEIYMSMVKMTSLLHDIKGGNDINELLFSITSLLDLITEFILKVNGNWCGDGKYRMRHINNFDKKFGDSLVNSLKEVYCSNNKQPLISLTESLLKKYGDLKSYYSKGSTLSKVSSNYLVIEINAENKITKNLIILNSIKDYLESLNSIKISYHFFLSKPVGKNKAEQNIYFIIDADKDFINNTIIPELNILVDKKKELSKIVFPFQFDPTIRFSPLENYKVLSLIFNKVSKGIINNRNINLNGSFQIEFSLKLFSIIKKEWFNNNINSFLFFLEYLIECWLIYSYDDGFSSRTSELLNKKKSTLKNFNKMYDSQKETLKERYLKKDNEIKNLFLGIDDVAKNLDFENIPLFKAYLINDKFKSIDKQKWSLYKEIIFRVLSIALIDNRYISYTPFIIKKIELDG